MIVDSLKAKYENFKQRVSDGLVENVARQDVALERERVCRMCPSLVYLTFSCKECGCFMKIKTRLAKMKCPLDKWKEQS